MPIRAEHAPDTDIAFVPATFELLPMLTVAENVALPVRLSGADPAGAVDPVTRQGALRRLRRISAQLGVEVVLATGDGA